MSKCKICSKYDFNKDECSKCSFEYDESLYWNNDDKWDILKLDFDTDCHNHIMYRLKNKGIECLSADIWYDKNLAVVIGADKNLEAVADALRVHRDCVYGNWEFPMIILNLYMEKEIREKGKLSY